MKDGVDVSVIIPTCRRPEYLAEALRKLQEVRGLSFEVLVVDDSPDAEGRAVVAALGDDRFAYSKRDIPSNRRPALLRNEAARRASGSVFYFLDDDDLVIPEALPQAYALLRDAPQGMLLTLPRPFGTDECKVNSETAYYEIARKTLDRRPLAHELEARLTFANSFVVPSACLIKREVFERMGGFDEAMELCEDVALFARTVASNGYVFSNNPIVWRRVGHTGLMAAAKQEALGRSYQQLRKDYRNRHSLPNYCRHRIRYWIERRLLRSRFNRRTSGNP